MSIPEPIYDKSCPRPTRHLLFHNPLPNAPGKCIIAFEVKHPLKGAMPPHRHGGASVTGYVLEGSIYNKMNDEPVQLLKKGDSWFEAPGCHHKVFMNASETEEARAIATYVVDSKVVEEGGYDALVTVDEEFR